MPAEQEYATQWRFLLSHFQVDTFCMTPATGALHQVYCKHDVELTELGSLDDAVRIWQDCEPVAIDENGELPLGGFEHPENALYLFGRTGATPMSQGRKSVYIECASGDRKPLLHPHQAAAIVLYDRLRKSWR